MSQMLERYPANVRMNHWAVTLLFVAAGLSGMAFFHPSLFFFTAFFGGGQWTRILHPFIGLLMFVSFMGLFIRLWRDNLMNAADKEWRKHTGDMLRGDKSRMPPVGKYNAGQKTIFWLMAGSLLLMLATGIFIWRPYFAGAFPIPVLRAAVLLHSVSAVVLVLATVVHVYAALWVKGTVRAMTRGTVSAAWAKANHRLWYDEVTRGGK